MRRILAVIACTCVGAPVVVADTPTDQPPPATPPPVTVSTMHGTTPVFVRDPDHGPPTGAWIATGVGGGLAVATLVWWLYGDHYVYGSRGNQPDGCVPNFVMGIDVNNCSAGNAGVGHRQHVWFYSEAALGAGTVGAAIAAAYLWSRHEGALHRVTVTPTPSGAAVSVGGSF